MFERYNKEINNLKLYQKTQTARSEDRIKRVEAELTELQSENNKLQTKLKILALEKQQFADQLSKSRLYDNK